MPYIYLGKKSGKYHQTISGIRVDFDVTTAAVADCTNAYKIVYKISYGNGFDNISTSYYQYTIYTGTDGTKYGKFEFSISCSANNNYFTQVETYYSLLYPTTPFFFAFIRGGTCYYATYAELKTRSYHNYYSLKNNSVDVVNNLAKSEYSSIYKDKKFQFSKGIGNNERIKQNPVSDRSPMTIGTRKLFKKMIFIPNPSFGPGVSFIFHKSGLFKLQPNDDKLTNEIDDSILNDVIDLYFHGVIIYYISSSVSTAGRSESPSFGEINDVDTSQTIPNNIAIVVQFIKDCDTNIQYERISRFKNQWKRSDAHFHYTDEASFIAKLNGVKSCLFDIISYKLDLSPSRNNFYYNNDSVLVKIESKSHYVTYIHTPTTHYSNKNSQVIFKNKKFNNSDSTIQNSKIESIRVYCRSQTTINESSNPILLVEFIEKLGLGNGNKRYYIRDSQNDHNWISLTIGMLKEMNIVDHVETEKDLSVIHKTPYILMEILNRAELNLYQKVVILFNKTVEYSDMDVQTQIGKTNSNFSNSNKQPKTINVDKTSFQEGYFHSKHIIKSIDIDGNSDFIAVIPYVCGIRVDIHNNKKTPSLLFYGGGGKCTNTISGFGNPNEFYVFSYGNDDIPLMFLYCKTLYGPLSKAEYRKWFELKTLTSFDNQQILTELNFIKNKLNLVDLSATDSTYNLSIEFASSRSDTINFKVESKNFDECDLFGVYKHTHLKSSDFKAIQFLLSINSNGGKTLTVLLDGEQQLTYVDVYYSLSNKQLLVVGIPHSTGIDYYRYNDFIKQTSDSFFLKALTKIHVDTKDNRLIDHLINEHDDRNNTVTYRLDRITERYKQASYNNNSITLTKNTDARDMGYNIYTHKSSREKISNVLYNHKTIKLSHADFTENKLYNIDNHKFSEIKTYSLFGNDDYHLLISLTENEENYYLYRIDKSDINWKQITNGFPPSNEKMDTIMQHQWKIKLLLNHINFLLGKSVIIDLTHKNYGYKIKVIDNASDNITGTVKTEKKNVTVFPEDFKSVYKYYEHTFRNVDTLADKKYIGGLRLSKGSNEIKLYDTQSVEQNRKYLYYETSMKGLYVYFLKDGNDPMMVCYDNNVYRPENKGNKDNQWFLVKTINSCTNFEKISLELNKIRTLFAGTSEKPSQSSSDIQDNSSSNPSYSSAQRGGSKEEISSAKSPNFTIAEIAGGATGGLAAVAGLVGGGFFALKQLGFIGAATVAAAV